MTRTTSKPLSLGLVAAALSLGLAACSLGSDLDVARSSANGGGGGGTTGAAGQAGGAQGGGSQGAAGSSSSDPVITPGCAIDGATTILGQGTATLDLDIPTHHTWDLEGGAFGQVIQDGVVKNRESHLDYGRGLKKLSVGVQGGEKGVILSLGPESDVATRLFAASPCTGFDRVAVIDGEINDPNGKQLFQTTPEGSASVTAVAGHIYVLRVVRKDEADIVAKLRVTAVEERSVTFAWVTLAPP